jgi:hypothetical protein
VNRLLPTPQLLAIAEQVVWFEEPTRALSDPIRFLAYLMTYGTHEEINAVQQYLAPNDVEEALENAPPGVFDERSWAYWNLMMGRDPVPPMPRRVIGESG